MMLLHVGAHNVYETVEGRGEERMREEMVFKRGGRWPLVAAS